MTESNELEALYASFARIYADGKPIRGVFELVAAIRAAGLEPGDVDEAWLRSLNGDWAYGEALLPFQDTDTNRLYRRFLTGG
ncbi:MAG: hypothetical protein OEN21_16690 [Myxococcales bacterium]|nr:hypothetical protein [Myxococcales bacterium]